VLVPRVPTAIAVSLVAFAAAFVPSFTCAQTPQVVAENAWARKPPAVDTAAVYLVLKNNSAKAVTLTGATSTMAAHAMIHETSVVDGQSRMRMRDKIVVAPGKSVALAPEGLHLMLTGFKYNVAVGDKVPLTLQFEGGSEIKVQAVVRPLDAK
jgi:copper(I)-binding protein